MTKNELAREYAGKSPTSKMPDGLQYTEFQVKMETKFAYTAGFDKAIEIIREWVEENKQEATDTDPFPVKYLDSHDLLQQLDNMGSNDDLITSQEEE